VNQFDRDRRCIERMADGDSTALAELYDRYSDLLYSLALRIVGGTSDAEEALQDTWMQAWRNAASYDASRGAVGAWLVTIVRSRALDRLRSLGSRRRAEAAAAREATVEPPQAAPDPATGHALRTLRKDVANAVAALAPQQRVVVELAYFEGLSQTEIAERLESPLGTVKSWTRQALLKLRERVPMEELP
jgi:RNA polymerase sigma-70 factor (ECF subfamily)